MIDDLTDLERELQSLRPRRASPRLEAGIAAGLAQSLPASHRRSATSWTSWKWTNWGVAAALVTLMVLVTVNQPPLAVPAPAGASVATSPAAVPGYTPVAAERTIYSADDEGVVILADGTSGRQLRSRYVDTITWRDPASNASLRWSVPQEEVRVVPIRVN